MATRRPPTPTCSSPACCRPTWTTSATGSTSSRACRAGTSTTSCAATDADAAVARHRAHELNAAGIARITGLADILPGGATRFNAGNIILGGDGSDLIEGRGGDDIIDGDRWLNVQLTDGTVSGDTMATFRNRVAAGTLDAGAISIARTLVDPGPGSATDTAIFSGLLAEYVITANSDGSTTIDHQGGIDGVDTLWNIEQLQFADQTVPVSGEAPGTPTLSVTPAGTRPLRRCSSGTSPSAAAPGGAVDHGVQHRAAAR